MNNNRFYSEFAMNAVCDWRKLYKTALLETDLSMQGECIRAAELAISEKRRQSALDHGGTPEENQAIEYALRGLDVLRKDILRWNGRKSSG